jgi:hypothetical protein
MKIVVQCSATKNPLAPSLFFGKRRVEFVAHPEHHPGTNSNATFRPDDLIPSTLLTWRESLAAYNAKGTNPYGLLSAGMLYAQPAYQKLLDYVAAENLYILSAGWGLIRSDYLLPDYDITFSSQCESWKRRKPCDHFQDFAHLTQDRIVEDETVYFFGGKAYLPLYYTLTQALPTRKVVYYRSKSIPENGAFKYIRYDCPGSTNWHYQCIKDFMADKIVR